MSAGLNACTRAVTTDSAGHASITYQGIPGNGFDTVQAATTVNGATLVSNAVTVTWYVELSHGPRRRLVQTEPAYSCDVNDQGAIPNADGRCGESHVRRGRRHQLGRAKRPIAAL
jgi:hypothetical protein